MNDKLKKSSICNVLALEMMDFSKKPKAEQTEIRKLFNGFVSQALIDIPQEDRAVVETANGATIVCSGPQEDALEDALFISITIRDEILKHNAHGQMPLYVQFGIHLGAVRALKKGLTGDGVEEARRIMSFAEPNQILASQGYFEQASKLTQDMARMFEKYEMHAHDHDVYAVRLLKETTVAEVPVVSAPELLDESTNGSYSESFSQTRSGSPSIPTDIAELEADPVQTITKKINWNYIGLGAIALVAFFVLGKLVSPTEPTITMDPTVVLETPEEKPQEVAEKPDEEPATEPVVEEPAKAVAEPEKRSEATKVTQKKTKQKTAVAEPVSKPEKTAEKPIEKPAEKVAEKSAESKTEKSSWQTVKESVANGAVRSCSQAEIAMNQCRQ
jgi:hypothetical protein